MHFFSIFAVILLKRFLNLFLCLKFILELVATTKDGSHRAGVMIPIPQYPIYSATISEYNNYQVSLMPSIAVIFSS